MKHPRHRHRAHRHRRPGISFLVPFPYAILACLFAATDAGTVLAQGLAETAAWLVAVLHFAYLLYAVFGGFLGLLGNRWLLAHLVSSAWAITVTATTSTCPLTWAEKWLIGQSGGVPYVGSFIEHYLEGHIYPMGYDAHVWYAGVVVVLSAYVLVILRRRRAKPQLPPEDQQLFSNGVATDCL